MGSLCRGFFPVVVVAFLWNERKNLPDALSRLHHFGCRAGGFLGPGRSAGAARTGLGTSGAAGWTRQNTPGGSEASSRPCAPTIGPRARGERRAWWRKSKSKLKASAESTRRPRWRGYTARAVPKTTTREARDDRSRERRRPRTCLTCATRAARSRRTACCFPTSPTARSCSGRFATATATRPRRGDCYARSFPPR